MTETDKTLLAAAARTQVIRHLQRDASDPNFSAFARFAIMGLLRTYDVAPDKAAPLLRRLIEKSRLERVGQYELPFLTIELSRLRDPAALEALYAAIFDDITLPDGKVSFGQPNVGLNLVESTRQRLDMARYSLGQRFQSFLTEHPAAAVRVMCDIVAKQRKARRNLKPIIVTFDGAERTLLLDSSNVWDSQVYHTEDWFSIVRAFEKRLVVELEAEKIDFFVTALHEIELHGPHLFHWRLLLRHAGATSETARLMLPLVSQRPILLAHELRSAVASYLASGYALLSESDRRSLDAAVLAVETEEADPKLQHARGRLVAEYAASIPLDVPTELAHKRTDAATNSGERQLNLEGVLIEAESIGPVTLSENAAEAGASKALQDAIEDATEFIHPPHSADVSRIPTLIQRIRDLSAGKGATVERAALDIMAELVFQGLQENGFDNTELANLTPLVLAAAGAPDEASCQMIDEDRLSFGSPNSVTAAARALPLLYKRTPSAAVADVIEGLASHSRPAVRNLIVRMAHLLADDDLERVWRIAERGVDDTSLGVVGTVAHLLQWLSRYDSGRARQSLLRAYDRQISRPANDIARHVINVVIDWALESADPAAWERLSRVIDDPWATPELANVIVYNLAARLDPTLPESAQPGTQRVLVTLSKKLVDRLEQLMQAHGTTLTLYPDAEKSAAETSIKLLGEIAERLYLSNVYRGGETTADLDDARYRLLQPLLSELSRAPLRRTAWNAIKMLTPAIPLAPKEVLQLGTNAIHSAKSDGLAGDVFAETDVRAFISRYVRTQRPLLINDHEALRRVMDVLDPFVAAGWPQWIDVAFDLDDIYRE